MATSLRPNSIKQQISFKPAELLTRAKERATNQGFSLSGYIQQLIRKDLEEAGTDMAEVTQQMEIRDIFGQKAEGQIVDALNKMSEEIQALKEIANPESKTLNAKHAEARDLVAKKVGVKKKKMA